MPWPSPARARIERVGKQHRVVERRDFDAAPGEDVPIEFDVLADLQHARVFEQRLEQLDRLALGDLAGQQPAAAEEVGLAGAMADRNVAGLPGRHGERDADEIGLQRIERSGLGVEGDEPCFERARDPAFELVATSSRSRRPRLRSFPPAPERPARRRGLWACGAGGRRARRAQRRGAGVMRRARRRSARSSRRCARASRRGRGNARRVRSHSRRRPQISPTRRVMVVSSIALRNAISGAPSSLGTPSVSSGTCDVDVAHQRHQRLRQPDQRDRFGVGQDFAALGLLDLVRAREQRIEIAVFADQLRRRLDADAARARHVVGGIAGERLDVDDLVGAGAEIGDDFVGADAPLLAVARGGIEHRDARARRAASGPCRRRRSARRRRVRAPGARRWR